MGGIVQCFDAKASLSRKGAYALALACKAAGFSVAVVTGDAGKGAKGLVVLHPLDRLPEGVDLVVWADHLTASDIDIRKLAHVSGMAPASTVFATRTGRWTMNGRAYVAAVHRPIDDRLLRPWMYAAWRPVVDMVAERGVSTIVLSDVPCPYPVAALVGIDDALPGKPARFVFLAARLMGVSGKAAMIERAPAIARQMGVKLTADELKSLGNLADRSLSDERRETVERMVKALISTKDGRN